ncbi:MAG TPA: flagellar type III secretion system pore protein FliP [Candidatus Sulfotelmatobacter sp.]|nr:flagellar type III secretion system pore protein FliP [Candidatus Sulfotelmatobacter sp.]
MRPSSIFPRLLGGLAATTALALLAAPAFAQTLSFDMGDGGGSTTARIIQLIALLTVLSLAPSILVMVTSFTRIIVVLSFLRTALGIQNAPPSSVIVSLALFLTAFIMAPTLEVAFDTGVKPLINEQISEGEALNRIIVPFHKFMMAHVRDRDLKLFIDLSKSPMPDRAEDTPLRALVPAFMISELRRAFEIGFLVFIPFLVIDMVVASVLLSMGMMMLPPAVVSLPFKLIFFVLVDGWFLIAGSLVQSFGPGG